MKKTLIALLSLVSLSSYAAFNEVECTLSTEDSEISVEVEQPFPAGSHFRQATVEATMNGAHKQFHYTVSSRRTGGVHQIQYLGAGLRLEVEFWPDSSPRWGRSYRGTMTSSDLSRNETFTNLNCYFPNAQY